MANPQRLFLSPSASSSPSVEKVWTTVFHDLCQRIKRSFRRTETYLHTLAYLQGLMSPVKRKNEWQVAEEAGPVSAHPCQGMSASAQAVCKPRKAAKTSGTPKSVMRSWKAVEPRALRAKRPTGCATRSHPYS
jgi:hypothetical protein